MNCSFSNIELRVRIQDQTKTTGNTYVPKTSITNTILTLLLATLLVTFLSMLLMVYIIKNAQKRYVLSSVKARDLRREMTNIPDILVEVCK